jgi:hypothetical protein
MSVQDTLLAAGLGAGAMYFLDPQSGEHRRTVVRDRVNSLAGDLKQLTVQGESVEPTRPRGTFDMSSPTARLLSLTLGGVAMFACWLRPSFTNIVLGTIGFGAAVNAATCSTARETSREPVMSR